MNPEREAVAEACLGYLHPTDGPILNRLALTCDGPFVELGSFAGKSTTWIGDAAEQRDTIVFAVDWHRGSPEMEPGQDCHIPEAIDPETGRHDTLRLLRRTLEAANLEDVVIPVTGRSQTVGKWWTTDIGFLFIDACHDVSVVEDYGLWSPRVRPGGLMAFHDWQIPPIHHCVRHAAGHGFELIEQDPSISVLRRLP